MKSSFLANSATKVTQDGMKRNFSRQASKYEGCKEALCDGCPGRGSLLASCVGMKSSFLANSATKSTQDGTKRNFSLGGLELRACPKCPFRLLSWTWLAVSELCGYEIKLSSQQCDQEHAGWYEEEFQPQRPRITSVP
jgi:hypothetical protein